MKTHTTRVLSASLLMIMVLMVGGCTGTAATSEIPTTINTSSLLRTAIPTDSQTFTPQPTITFRPTPTPTITPTEIPAAEAERLYKDLISLLQDKNCVLPCVMGIDPKVTTTVDVRDLLLPFQGLTQYAELMVDFDGYIDIEYPIDTRTSTLIDIYYSLSEKNQGRLDHVILHTRPLFEGADYNSPDTYASLEYHQLLQRYTLPTILTTFGHPIQVYVSVMPSGGGEAWAPSFFDLLLSYQEKGFYISYSSLANEREGLYHACPTNSFIGIWSENPTTGGLSKDIADRIYNMIWPEVNFFILGFKPLDEATSMSNDEFYQIFHQPTNQCLDSPKSTWPTHP